MFHCGFGHRCFGCANDLTKTVSRHLADGKIVKLGDCGNFQIPISSDGAETAEKLTLSLIRSNKSKFLPGVDLRDMLSKVKYEKYSR